MSSWSWIREVRGVRGKSRKTLVLVRAKGLGASSGTPGERFKAPGTRSYISLAFTLKRFLGSRSVCVNQKIHFYTFCRFLWWLHVEKVRSYGEKVVDSSSCVYGYNCVSTFL